MPIALLQRDESAKITAREVARCFLPDVDVAYASASHFFKKLVFAAPASGLPFLSIAFGSQACFAHFVM
jgi:hypothetical protein